jgi:SNF2 family DNA or RNA helicase
MSNRASSRVYNRAALESWFEYVAHDWESAFSVDALKRGREIYRNDEISGIELSDKDAIVHCAFSRKDTCYVVLEWDSGKPVVRFSKEDTFLGNAIAAGGLYEIEELIADEIEPLPYIPRQVEAPDAVKETKAPEPVEVKSSEAELTRRLVPYFSIVGSSLKMRPLWENLNSKDKSSFSGDDTSLHSAERELLVQLTALAKEAGFEFRRKFNDFVLSDPNLVATFFDKTLIHWKKVFGRFQLDTDAQRLLEGVKQVSINGSAKPLGNDLMRVDWRLKMGSRWLDSKYNRHLARIGRGTHIVKKLGLVRITEDQAETFNEWQFAFNNGDESTKAWPRYMLFSLFDAHGIKVDLEDALRDWRARIEANTFSNEALKGKSLPDFLRPYQTHGVYWMANLRVQNCHGLLADEMGLGKTLQVLTLLNVYPFEDKDSLVVCPASVVPVWEAEAKHWYPDMDVAVLSSRHLFSHPTKPGPRLWIASYTQLRRHKHLLGEAEFGYAILDEAQQIKNPDAKVTHACCAIRAECRLALTGTPIENRLLDMWTLFRFLMPGLLGSRRRFEAKATSTNEFMRVSLEQALRSQIAPFLLRRKKDEVGNDLPPKVEMDLVCPVTDVQRQMYKRLLDESSEALGDNLQEIVSTQSMNFFTLLTRLRQACCDPGLIPGVDADPLQSGKVQMLLTRLSEALTGKGARKVVVFSQFVQLLKRVKPLIKKEFPNIRMLELTGQTKDRSKPVKTFQESEGATVILISLKAGGTGITLHAADYVFLLDPWWNPAIENQAIDRVHRIGQRKRVFVYRMITKGTIEERIQQLKAEKRELFESTLSDLGRTSNLLDHFNDLQKLAGLL